MLMVAGILAIFFFVTRSCKKEAEAYTTTKPAAKSPQAPPAGKDGKEPAKKAPESPQGNVAKNTPAAPGTPPGASPAPPANPATPPKADDEPTARPPAEPVREVATNSAEGAAMVNDAIARVDEAPTDIYPDKAKAKVREGLKAARRIFKVDTIYFEKGGAILDATAKKHLDQSLQDVALEEPLNDPRAVLFVLGFADKTGAADTNKKLSRERADAVINLIRKEFGILNLTYPVAIGPTELVSGANQQKNRAAEVWLVLP